MTEAKTFTEAEKRVTLAAVGIVFLLSALDQTIVATAMPRIIADLQGITLYSWVMTIYMLSSTVSVPIWGKLCDLYGRKPILLAGIGFFLVGSWLSGLSGEFGDIPFIGGGMVQLIVFRALQGIGGGALFTTAFAIIADLFPPRERGKVGGMFAAVFGLSSIAGPLIGGYFTDHGTVTLAGHVIDGWRWVFYLNLPLSVLSLFMVIVKMPAMSHQAKGKIDYIGAILIIATFVPFLLALSFGGHTVGGRHYDWNSPTVIGLFAGSAAGLIAYIINERFASDPILPLDLFKNKVFTTANLAGFLVSMSFMSTVALLPIFMQIGQGVQATTSGLSTLPLMAGLMASAILSGRLVTRFGKYKIFMLAGVMVTFVGIFFMSQMHVGTTRADLAWRMFILGVGLGPGQSLFNLAVQNAMPMNRLGVVTSANQFFRQIGATMGIALFGAIQIQNMKNDVAKLLPPGVDIDKLLQGMAVPGQTQAHAVPAAFREIITTSVTDVFTLGLFVIVAAGIVVLFIPELPMRDRAAMAAAAAKAAKEDHAVPPDAHL